MSGSGGPRPKDLPVFDFNPIPSLEAALDIFEESGAAFALAGRLAVWASVPEDEQAYTKDVDFAVPRASIASIEAAIRRRGMTVHPRSIGGVAVREAPVRLDFIDRRVDFGDLFEAAIDAARARGTTYEAPSGRAIPVVPADFVVAMKLATGEPKDELDAERIVRANEASYGQIRATVRRFHGPAMANRLDRLAARAGITEAARYVRAGHGPSNPA